MMPGRSRLPLRRCGVGVSSCLCSVCRFNGPWCRYPWRVWAQWFRPLQRNLEGITGVLRAHGWPVLVPICAVVGFWSARWGLVRVTGA